MADIVGYDPDKDYLLDPQQLDTFPGRCDCCGHLIHRGDLFYRLDLPKWLCDAAKKSELMICDSCKADLDKTDAEWVGVRYGA